MSDPRPVTAADLAALEFFEGLPEGALEPGASIYWLVRGRLAIRIAHDGHSLIVMTLEPGEILGWSTLRGHATTLSTARAAGPTELIEVPTEVVLDLLASGLPESRLLIQRLAAAASDHLERTRHQLLNRGHNGLITGG